ncbi:MAG TPA: hypothetical protein VEJ88_05790 [Dissulfurispiraceae bacterium]|nr:hypothetical protein [Dissulfurispiraceae bacterium]
MKKILLFSIVIVTLTALLVFFNWLPLRMDEGIARRYSSIEEVKTKLKLKEVFVPSFFPQQYVWPPYEIIAQTKPFTSVIMKFRRIDGKPDGLVICQFSAAASVPDCLPHMLQITERTAFKMKGRMAVLEVGACAHNDVCSRISWLEGSYRITVAVDAPPFDLVKISESMIR